MSDKKWKLLLLGISLTIAGFMIGFLAGSSPAIVGSRTLLVTQAQESSDSQKTISLSTATQSDLMRLPQIGEKTAEKIIKYRESQGRFQSLEELKNVNGIGDKTFKRIAPFLTL